MCKLALLCETRQFFVNMKSSLYRIFPQQIYQPLYGILACSSVCRTCKFTCIVKSDGTCHQCCFMRIISTNSIHKICGLQKRYPTVTEKILNFLFMSLSKPHIYMIYLNCVCLSVCMCVSLYFHNAMIYKGSANLWSAFNCWFQFWRHVFCSYCFVSQN